MKTIFLTTVSIASVLAGAAAAQSEPPATSPSTVDDIVVTAQKRSERLQDVPVSISVLGAFQASTDIKAALADRTA